MSLSAPPGPLAAAATGMPAAAPGSDENVFTFWPRHNAAIYQALADRHTQVEVGAAVGGDGAEYTDALHSKDPLESSMVLNLGPQHPATHGALRIVCQLDGETVEKCLLDVGYLHRGIEKLAEVKTYQEFMPYTDRMDYMSPVLEQRGVVPGGREAGRHRGARSGRSGSARSAASSRASRRTCSGPARW